MGIGLAAFGETLLDVLDLSAPTFRTAAGVVVAVSGAVHVWGRTAPPVEGDGVFGGAVAGLYPAPVFAAVVAGVDAGWLPAAGPWRRPPRSPGGWSPGPMTTGP